MKIIKRNGAEVNFDITKIILAISKANETVEEANRLNPTQIRQIANSVVYQCEKLGRTPTVEEVQDMVERHIMNFGTFEVAKNYITYRYTRSLVRKSNTTDDKILSLIECANEEAKQENANKNPVVNSTQRDYIAGEVSRDITNRILLPKEIVDAHNEGIIHFHDTDYYAQHMHNCFTGGTKFVTDKGIRRFRDFKDGDTVFVKSFDGAIREATVHKYGKQKMQKVTLKNPRQSVSIICTPNHRWKLADGSVTTELEVGNALCGVENSTQYEINTYDEANAFCTGFLIGDGCDKLPNSSIVRLCKGKTQYADIFQMAGYSIHPIKGSDDLTAYKRDCAKQNFLNAKGWRFLPANLKALVFKGLYAADGSRNGNKLTTTDERVCLLVEELSGIAGYYISSKGIETRNTNYKANSTLYAYHFITSTPVNWNWKVVKIEKYAHGEVDAWCVEEPVTHTFVLDKGVVTGNCDLVNLEDMLQNGTVITGTMIEKPHTFATACNIATQIVAQVASNQYGGQTISLTHLAPFVNASRLKYRKTVREEMELAGITNCDEAKINDIAELRTKDEVRRGVQTIQYQVNTLLTTNGQTPFITVFMYLNEAEDEQTKGDLAMIIEEVLRQRIQGVKNEKGVWITPAFPKLIYVLDEDNVYEGTPYWYLTKLAAKCTAKRMVPDYISAKKMKELKGGDVYTCMGCRSFLTPDRFTDAGIGNIANAGNYEPGKHKYYGRFNQGVVTINLPDVALSSGGNIEKFWKIFDERLELCYRALMCRHERLKGTLSDAAPILWQYGALARLEKGEPIDKLLFNGYSTISLGYAGLYECVKYMTGKSHTDPSATPFALSVMQHMNDACKKWKEKTNIDFSIYGSPIESTTYKFAKCLQKRFGIIDGITDRSYITNSYHVHVSEPINAFDKLGFEAQFQHLSPGGAISYVEVPDMQNNIEAVLSVMQFIYDNIIYAELNTKSDYCQECGWDGEIGVVDIDGKLVWKCPKCGNTNQDKMNIARRTCGYIGSQYWNQGRTAEIADRCLHL